jgi:SAM-dependent methyltransferase
MFWAYCAAKYPRHFRRSDVLEVGSYDVNGSVRKYFSNPGKYVGVDWRPGRGVDVVSFAHEMAFDAPFDVVISASMLEHDRHWEKSLRKMVEFLKEDGILLLSWGGALNRAHDLDTADDCCFHALPAGRVIDLLRSMGLYVHEFRYEGMQFPKDCMGNGLGEVCLVAFRSEGHAVGDPHIDELLPEDRGEAPPEQAP